MSPNVRDRIVLPIAIPLMGLLLLEILVFPFSRILIAVGKTPALFVASAAALLILGVSALISASPRIRSSTLIGLSVIGIVTVVAGGLWAMPRLEDGLATHAHHDVEHVTEEPHDGIEVHAARNQFDTDLIPVPAGEDLTIRFTHNDPEPHNIAIFADDTMAELIFRGDIIDGGEIVDYEIEALDPGDYFFHCDVHPQMQGTLRAG